MTKFVDILSTVIDVTHGGIRRRVSRYGSRYYTIVNDQEPIHVTSEMASKTAKELMLLWHREMHSGHVKMARDPSAYEALTGENGF